MGVCRPIHSATETEGECISLGIYFILLLLFSIRKKEPDTIAGSNPTVSTTVNTIKHLQLLRPLTTPLGVANQQICKLQTASSDLSIYRHVSLIGQCSLWSSLETIVLLVVSHSCACARKLITTIFLHIEYSTTLYFTAKPLWHL